jgi:hypothetical protein
MKPTSDLRAALTRLKSEFEGLPCDLARVEACGVELGLLGAEVAAALEVEFLAFVEPTAA